MIKDDFGVEEEISFVNAHMYLYDYLEAKDQQARLDKDFEDPEKAAKLIEKYESDYMYEGVLRTDYVTQVITQEFSKNLNQVTFEKMKERNGELSSEYFKNLKHIHYFTYQQQLAAILAQLDVENRYLPQDGDSL